MKLARGQNPGLPVRGAVIFVFALCGMSSPVALSGAELPAKSPLRNETNAVGGPTGWTVKEVAVDPVLAALSNEALVDRLQEAEVDLARLQNAPDHFWPIGGRPNLGSPGAPKYFTSDAAIELVRRGPAAVPSLLKHLDDARRTQLVYVVAPLNPAQKGPPWLSDEYDARVRENGADALAFPDTNTKAQIPIEGDGTYTFKVGDLCYVALGQIVDRALYASRSAEFGISFGDPSRRPNFDVINSPVERPALAAAARKDWSGIAAEEHEQQLRGGIFPAGAQRQINYSALTRLLFYYPKSGAAFVERLLGRALIEPKTGEASPAASDEQRVSFWNQAALVGQVGSFRWDGLRDGLVHVYQQAARMAETDLQQLPPATWDPAIPRLGSDLALTCARQLLHQGHDEEFKTFFTVRADAIRAAMQAKPPVNNGFDSLKLVNSMQERACRAFVRQIEGGTAETEEKTRAGDGWSDVPVGSAVRLGSITAVPRAAPGRGGLRINVELIEPAPERVLEGRAVVSRARDDAGVKLTQEGIPNFNAPAVGRTSDAILTGFPKSEFLIELTRPAPKAKALTTLEGRLELVVPDLDPQAMVVIDDLALKFGTPVESGALRANGLTVTVLDRAAYGRFTAALAAAPTGAQAEAWAGMLTPGFGSFGSPLGPLRQLELQAGDVALQIVDSKQRLGRVEFQGKDGGPLRYNRNGWSHSSGEGGRRFDIYRLGPEIPVGTRLVLWLITEKSRVVVPFSTTDLPLP